MMLQSVQIDGHCNSGRDGGGGFRVCKILGRREMEGC
jgi:hypothetical protein